MIACSARTGRAVIMDSTPRPGEPCIFHVTFVSVIDVRSGRVMYHHDYPDDSTITNLHASADGRYLAESDRSETTTQVRDLTSGSVVASVPGTARGFSGDGSRLVTVTKSGTTTVFEWRTGRVVWSVAGNATAMSTRPGGKEIAVAAGLPDRQYHVLLVPARGPAVQLAQSTFVTVYPQR